MKTLQTIQSMLSGTFTPEETLVYLAITVMEQNQSPVCTSAKKLSLFLYGNETKTSSISRCIRSLTSSGKLTVQKRGRNYYYSSPDASLYVTDEIQVTHDVHSPIININNINTIKENDKYRADYIERTLRDQQTHYTTYEGTGIVINTRNGKVKLDRNQIIHYSSILEEGDLEKIAAKLIHKTNMNKTYITSAMFLYAINKESKKQEKKQETRAKELIHYDACMDYAPYRKELFDKTCSVVMSILEKRPEENLYLSVTRTVTVKEMILRMDGLSFNDMLYFYSLLEERDIHNGEKYILALLYDLKSNIEKHRRLYPGVPLKLLTDQQTYEYMVRFLNKCSNKKSAGRKPLPASIQTA